MKLAILSSTLLLSAVLAAPVPAAPDATHLAAPVASPGGSDPLGLDQALSNLGLLPATPPMPPSPRAVSSDSAPSASPGGSDPLGLDQALNNLGLLPATPPLPPSPRAVSSSSATSALNLEQTVDGLLGAANGEQTGNSGLGGIKKRTSDPSSPAPGSLDLSSLIGELTGGQKGGANGLSGIVPTMKRTPQNSGVDVDGIPVPLAPVLGLAGALGGLR